MMFQFICGILDYISACSVFNSAIEAGVRSTFDEIAAVAAASPAPVARQKLNSKWIASVLRRGRHRIANFSRVLIIVII